MILPPIASWAFDLGALKPPWKPQSASGLLLSAAATERHFLFVVGVSERLPSHSLRHAHPPLKE